MLNNTYAIRMQLKEVDGGEYTLAEPPNGYESISRSFLMDYNYYAQQSHIYYEKWNQEWDLLHPSIDIRDGEGEKLYFRFLEDRIVKKWNSVSIFTDLVSVDLSNGDFFYVYKHGMMYNY